MSINFSLNVQFRLCKSYLNLLLEPTINEIREQKLH